MRPRYRQDGPVRAVADGADAEDPASGGHGFASMLPDGRAVLERQGANPHQIHVREDMTQRLLCMHERCMQTHAEK